MSSARAADKKDLFEEDFLDEDPEIRGQKVALISFVSPEKILARKDIFFFENFMRHYEVESKTKIVETFLAETITAVNRDLDAHAATLEKAGQVEAAEICRKNRVQPEEYFARFETHMKKMAAEMRKASKITDSYDNFMTENQTRLEDEFHAANDFHTTIRGFKIRGVFETEAAADAYAKGKLRRIDKRHDIYCAKVGFWTPWHPDPSQVKDQEYATEELNTLMKKYNENLDAKDEFFEQRKEAAKKAAAAAGAKQADASAGLEEAKKAPFMTVEPVLTTKLEDEEAGAAGAAAPANVLLEGSGPATMGATAATAALFGGEDLALRRKLEREGGGSDAA